MFEGDTLWLIFGTIIISMSLSAFFSASETGLTAITRSRIHNLVVEGNRRAKLVSELRKRKEALIGTVLFGNTVVNIGASALVTSLAIKWMGDEGVVYATFGMTVLILVFGELMPKTYAILNPEKVALAVAPLFYPLLKLFAPVTLLAQKISNLGFRMFGIDVEAKGSTPVIEALRGQIEFHHQEGQIIKHDRDMLGGILELGDITVSEIMVHRKQMVTIDLGEPADVIIEHMLASPHTRIPLYEGEPDNIVAVLHAKNLLQLLKTKHEVTAQDIKDVAHKAWFIPDSTSLKDQLSAFRARGNHFALVVDEYGALLGLVTLEDIIEEIVGHIHDEHDIRKTHIFREGEGRFVVDGMLTIRDLNRDLSVDLPDDEASTIAGLLLHEAERIPEVGESFTFHGYRMEVLARDGNQITRIRLEELPEEAAAE